LESELRREGSACQVKNRADLDLERENPKHKTIVEFRFLSRIEGLSECAL
jgi:hypothetical protein